MNRDRIVEVILRAKDTTALVVGKFRQRMKAMQTVVMDVTKVVAASTAAVGALVLGLTKLGERGDKVNAVKRAFARVTGDETAALQKLRAAAGGMISDFELMARNNQALTLGAADSVDQFAELVSISRELGRAQGIEATAALESLTTGLGRQSKLMLDNLGILVNTEGAYERYAASLGKTAAQLTDTERRTAFMSEAMEQARQKAAELRSETDGGTSATGRFSTAIQNLRDRLAEFVAESPEVAKAFDFVTEAVNNVATAVGSGDMDTLKRVFEELGRIAGNSFSIGMQQAVSGARGFLGRMAEALVPGLDENQRRAMEDHKRARGIFGIGGGDRRGILSVGLDKLESELAESAELAKENIAVAMQALAEIAEQARQRAAAMGAGVGGGLAAAGAGGGGGGGGGALTIGSPTGPALPSMFNPDAVAAYQMRRDRVRLQPINAPAIGGLTNPFQGIDVSEQIARDTQGFEESGEKFGAAAQVATAGMLSVAEAMVRGSDQIEASLISMVTNVLQSIPSIGGGIWGTLIGGFGGILTAAFSRGSRDPVPVRIRDIDDDAARKMQPRSGPDRISTTTETGRNVMDVIERELWERQNRDEVVRWSRGTTVR